MRAGIVLGSNLGDRHAFLQGAAEELKKIHEGGDFLLSSFYETDPLDCPPDSPRFLNAALELETSLPPLSLLDQLQALECQSGRPSQHEFHGSRTLDLDILYWGELVLNSEKLTLPHPRMTERLFVLKPLAEIRPDLKLPGWSMACQKYLFNINKNNI